MQPWNDTGDGGPESEEMGREAQAPAPAQISQADNDLVIRFTRRVVWTDSDLALPCAHRNDEPSKVLIFVGSLNGQNAYRRSRNNR